MISSGQVIFHKNIVPMNCHLFPMNSLVYILPANTLFQLNLLGTCQVLIFIPNEFIGTYFLENTLFQLNLLGTIKVLIFIPNEFIGTFSPEHRWH